MNCPVCKSKMLVQNTTQLTTRTIRLYKCTNCSRKFVSEDILHFVGTQKGTELKLELERLRYERKKMQALIPKPKREPKPPRQRRKVAPKPGTRIEEAVYLTYGQLFEKFTAACLCPELINDYRPYPLLDYSIIVWFNGGDEKAYQYNPETDVFIQIENATTYEDILENAWGRRKRA